jgi:microcystin degradation protein MlrC
MGRCVVVQYAGITVLVTSLRVMPTDLGPWLSVGLDPSTFSVIGVKAAVSHRRAYDPIAVRSIWLNTPGPCDENLARLPYKNISRPIWPLDEIYEIKTP